MKTSDKTIKKSQKTKRSLPSFWSLSAKTWQELTTFWRPLFGVTGVYAILYFALVLGFNLAYSYTDITDEVAASLGGNPSWFAKSSLTIVNLFASSNQSDAGAIVQFLLFVTATLAIIWVLRQLRSLKRIKMRDAYFEGTARIVPMILTVVLLLVPFIPIAIGSAIFSVTQAGQAVEAITGTVIAGILLFVTLYWFCAWLPAIYIVSLPKGTPVKAIRAAAKLTKHNRFWMVRNMLVFLLLTCLIVFSVMLLFVLLASQASIVAAYVTSFIVFCVAQTFIFTLYRGLLDEA